MGTATKNNTYKLTVTAIFAAISLILMLFGFSFPGIPDFLKFELSDLPALIVSFGLGPLYGICVVFIKNIIHLFFTSTGGIGEFSNFIISSVFVFCAGIIYKVKPTKKIALISMIISTFVTSSVAVILNYYIFIPLYSFIIPIDSIINLVSSTIFWVDTLLKFILVVILPFNFIKEIVVSILTFVLYKRISPLLK